MTRFCTACDSADHDIRRCDQPRAVARVRLAQLLRLWRRARALVDPAWDDLREHIELAADVVDLDVELACAHLDFALEQWPRAPRHSRELYVEPGRRKSVAIAANALDRAAEAT